MVESDPARLPDADEDVPLAQLEGVPAAFAVALLGAARLDPHELRGIGGGDPQHPFQARQDLVQGQRRHGAGV